MCPEFPNGCKFFQCAFFSLRLLSIPSTKEGIWLQRLWSSQKFIRLTTSKFLVSNTLAIQTSTFCCCCCYCCKLELLFFQNAEFNLPIYFLEKSLSFKGPNHGSNSIILYFRPPIAFFFFHWVGLFPLKVDQKVVAWIFYISFIIFGLCCFVTLNIFSPN